MPCFNCGKPSLKDTVNGSCGGWSCRAAYGRTVSFNCKWCDRQLKNQKAIVQNQNKYLENQMVKYGCCSIGCFQYFQQNKCGRGEQILNFLFKRQSVVPAGGKGGPTAYKGPDFSDILGGSGLAQLGAASKDWNNFTTREQLGDFYEKDATHYDAGRGAVVVPKDEMIQTAIRSYRTACKLFGDGKPVILYRVGDRKRLSEDEHNTQTVAGAVKSDFWPLERTAAWIQGAMRARVSFLMLTDPRGEGNLVGGKDKSSDAVYVRELFQISQTKYTIAKASGKEIPAGWRKGSPAAIFKMVPPANESGPLPIVPRLRKNMDFDHTWDSAKSSLTVDADDSTSMAEHVKELFTAAGETLGIGDY